MPKTLINREFYDAIINFDKDVEAQELYYRVMNTETGKVSENGHKETVRDRILRVYAMLFGAATGANSALTAGPDEVEATADRLYIGAMKLDPSHWYRMQHHFPVIDDDNYDRFAALVIADLNAGPLRDAAVNDGDMLLVGEVDPLHMTQEQRQNQQVRVIGGSGGPKEES